MNSELLRRWTDETVPALCKHWQDKFRIEYWHGMTTPHLICTANVIPEGVQMFAASLDSMRHISELIGVETETARVRAHGAPVRWCGIYGDDMRHTQTYPTEPDARLAAVIEAVAALVREKEAGNAGA